MMEYVKLKNMMKPTTNQISTIKSCKKFPKDNETPEKDIYL